MEERERNLILQAFEEDACRSDVTTSATTDKNISGRATFLAKAGGILAGIDITLEVFTIFAKQSQREHFVNSIKNISDGKKIFPGDEVAYVSAPLDILLTAERVSLNLLQRISGIATLTHEYVKAVQGTNAKILDTRKTAPLLRPFDRYGVRAGGGKNHRYSLAEMILVKDNHIAANNGDISAVIEKIKKYFQDQPIISVEIEVTTLDQLKIILDQGKNIVTRVLLDNFEISTLHTAVEMNDGIFETEASGGVNLSNVRSIAETGVDYISIGALTHSVKGLDISLEIE